MDGRVLRSRRYRRYHRTLANHCSSLPPPPRPGCYNQCAVHRGVRRSHRRREEEDQERTDRRSRSESDFSSMQLFNEHRHRSRCAGRKQQSEKESCMNIKKRPIGRFVAVLLFSEDLPPYLFFAYTALANGEREC